MAWKVPISTDILNNPSLSTLEQCLYCLILLRACNKPMIYQFTQNGRHFAVKLDKGQMIFKKQKIADELKIDCKRITRGLLILKEWETQLETESRPFGTVVTLKNYDDLIKMESKVENERRASGERAESERRPNKSVKSDKNVKSVERYPQIDFEKMDSKMRIPAGSAETMWKRLTTWSEAKGKTYKNWEKALENWLVKDIADKKIKQRSAPEKTSEWEKEWLIAHGRGEEVIE